MDYLGKELMDFLASASLKKARNELYDVLGAHVDEVNVYYLISLINLKNIISDGGIRCRAMAGKDGLDLSAQYVQEMRDKKLQLAQKISLDEEIIDKNIHQCINFFWNPINNTSRAFQRNSLLMESSHDIHRIVCIIEVGLNSFFESNKVYWCISNKNLASYVSPTFNKRIYEKFLWSSIFSMKNDKDTNQARSAEFIAFNKNDELINSDLIPVQYIKRILVPAHNQQKVKEILPLFQEKIYSPVNSKVFPSKEELLKAEKYLIKTLTNLQELDLTIEDFCRLINTFSDFKEELACSVTVECFDIKEIAHSFHGIGHVTRVMFWVHVLCYLSNTSPQIEKVVQYAAYIHDFCRNNNSQENEHGLMAALTYEDFLRRKQMKEDLMHSCMNAVIYHCKDDTECSNTDLVWKILKDADSLDRGRFGPPEGLINKRRKSKGCDVGNLRLDIFRDSPQLTEKLAWLAYWIAGMTRFTKWSENTFMDLKRALIVSLQTSMRNNVLEPDEFQIADKIIRYLLI